MSTLFATRWYPSFDLPMRGSFVADLAAALVAAGEPVRVVSWETAVDRRAGATASAIPATPPAWLDAVRAAPVEAAPTSWGARGVPVTRLPAVTVVGSGRGSDALAVAATQAEALLAWASGPAAPRPSVVHAHTGLPDGLAALALAERLGVPLVTTEHESLAPSRLEDPAARAAYRRLLEDGRVLLAVSASLRDRLARALGVDPARIGVVPNPVDGAPFAAAAGTVPRDPAELLWVGNRRPDKGMDVLLGAFARLRAERPSLHLRLVGRASTAADDARLAALARDLGVADAVAFEPPAGRPAIAAAMARAAVFVHPSPSETFGVVAAEAVAAGLPVAATPSGGVDEILGADGRLGVLAADTGADALAAAVREVLDWPGRFDPAAMAASIEGRFGPGVVARRLLEVYASAIAAARGARVGFGSVAPAGVGSAAPSPPPADAPTSPAATPFDAPTSPAATPFDAGILVVAATGVERNRVMALPAALLAGLTVVTLVAGRREAEALPAGPRWAALDPMRAYKAERAVLGVPRHRGSLPVRLVRAVLHPRRTRAIRRLVARREAVGREGLREDLRAVLAGAATPAGTRILALTVDDLALVAPLLGGDVRPWPSTLRGLADAWDAAGRPVLAAPAPAAGTPVYDAASYWARLHERADLSAVGQSARSAALNRWLYRALETSLRSFVRRHGVVSPPPAAAFDVGIGIGYWVHVWRDLGIPRVDGCDLVPAAIETARLAAERAGVAGSFLVADVSRPDAFEGRAYPLVSCCNVLLHVMDDDGFRTALANIASLVEPGGRLLLAEPILFHAEQDRPHDPSQHSRPRPLAAYRDPLIAAGLELVAVEPGTVLANNPIEAGSPAARRRFDAWWRFVVARDRAGARWIGPLVAALDRVAMRSGAAPTTKLALFRRPPAG